MNAHFFRFASSILFVALAISSPLALASSSNNEASTSRIKATIQAPGSTEPALTPEQDKAVNEAALKQLQAFGGKHQIPGVYIAIYMPGKAPYLKGVGLADIKTKAEFKTLDRFRIGSNTKTFVVSVLLQLQDERLLSVDDPISKFKIGVNVPNGDHITIRQLAEMRSGLFEAYNTRQFKSLNFTPNMQIAPNEMISWALKHKPLFPPDARWNYSNTNYLILGRIIEVVTHDTVGNQIRKRLIEPLGLTATVVADTVTMPSPYAHGYATDAKGNWEDVT